MGLGLDQHTGRTAALFPKMGLLSLRFLTDIFSHAPFGRAGLGNLEFVFFSRYFAKAVTVPFLAAGDRRLICFWDLERGLCGGKRRLATLA